MLLHVLALSGALLIDSLTLDIKLPAVVRTGDTVAITLRLTNTGDQPLTVYLQGRPVAFDVTVKRTDGAPVWRRLKGAVVSAVLQVRTLAPGEVLEFSDTWSQQSNFKEPVTPGEYLVTGVLAMDPPAELRSEPVRLRILP